MPHGQQQTTTLLSIHLVFPLLLFYTRAITAITQGTSYGVLTSMPLVPKPLSKYTSLAALHLDIRYGLTRSSLDHGKEMPFTVTTKAHSPSQRHWRKARTTSSLSFKTTKDTKKIGPLPATISKHPEVSSAIPSLAVLPRLWHFGKSQETSEEKAYDHLYLVVRLEDTDLASGDQYVDTTRGPLNEGGLFGERQGMVYKMLIKRNYSNTGNIGWHLPGFNDASWAAGKPTTGIPAAGVSFYR